MSGPGRRTKLNHRPTGEIEDEPHHEKGEGGEKNLGYTFRLPAGDLGGRSTFSQNEDARRAQEAAFVGQYAFAAEETGATRAAGDGLPIVMVKTALECEARHLGFSSRCRAAGEEAPSPDQVSPSTGT